MDSTVVVTSKKSGILGQRTSDKTGNMRNGGSSPVKILVFVYYSKIAEILEDNTWKDFFHIMSKGSFWKGLKFDGTQLVSKQKNTTKTHLVMVSGEMNIETDFEADVEYYTECKKFIMLNTSHFAKRENEDEILSKILIAQPTKTGVESSISKQIMYIEEFATSQCEANSLSNKIKTCLVSSIFVKLSNKALTPKSLIFGETGVIFRIEGLVIDSTGYYFDDSIIDPPIKKEKKQAEVKEKKLAFKCSKNLGNCLKA